MNSKMKLSSWSLSNKPACFGRQPVDFKLQGFGNIEKAEGCHNPKRKDIKMKKTIILVACTIAVSFCFCTNSFAIGRGDRVERRVDHRDNTSDRVDDKQDFREERRDCTGEGADCRSDNRQDKRSDTVDRTEDRVDDRRDRRF